LEANIHNIPNGLRLYNQLLDVGIQNCLPKTLEFCKDTVKLVIICSGNAQAIEQAIRQTLQERIQDVEIVVMPKSDVPRWAWENRNRLIQRLGLENVFP
jgi:2-hydroxy-3-keto-5-methylthiopentenyl-1-phosphate phosphatase